MRNFLFLCSNAYFFLYVCFVATQYQSNGLLTACINNLGDKRFIMLTHTVTLNTVLPTNLKYATHPCISTVKIIDQGVSNA